MKLASFGQSGPLGQLSHIGHQTLDVFLEPGQFHFGGDDLRIGTLLGSCVAITMWHPRTRIGGMCHYLLPSRRPAPYPAGAGAEAAEWIRAAAHGRAGYDLDGRYGDEAVAMFLAEIGRIGTAPADFEAKLFGGGDQFPGQELSIMNVPARNVDAGLEMLSRVDLPPVSRHVGGSGPRVVVLDLASGDVWVRHRRLLRKETRE